jgi:NAD(P)-dependent dehydrogenase (short-subunit alcohol dehydrogenase family)
MGEMVGLASSRRNQSEPDRHEHPRVRRHDGYQRPFHISVHPSHGSRDAGATAGHDPHIVDGLAGEAVCCATKFAQVGFARALDRELELHGTKVWVFRPGGVKSTQRTLEQEMKENSFSKEKIRPPGLPGPGP